MDGYISTGQMNRPKWGMGDANERMDPDRGEALSVARHSPSPSPSKEGLPRC